MGIQYFDNDTWSPTGMALAVLDAGWSAPCPTRRITTYWYRRNGNDWRRISWLRYLLLRLDLDNGEQIAKAES
jgi:hypothetical protein